MNIPDKFGGSEGNITKDNVIQLIFPCGISFLSIQDISFEIETLYTYRSYQYNQATVYRDNSGRLRANDLTSVNTCAANYSLLTLIHCQFSSLVYLHFVLRARIFCTCNGRVPTHIVFSNSLCFPCVFPVRPQIFPCTNLHNL